MKHSDTEQSCASENEYEGTASIPLGVSPVYLGKDKETEWSVHPPRLVYCTNISVDKICVIHGCQRDCGSTIFVELSVSLGLLYLHLNIEEFFSENGTSPECFRAIMSMERFYLLLCAFRFDSINDRNASKLTDNLILIRNIFEQFVTQYVPKYQLGEYVTVDAMLETFRGRCKFRQYIANKPATYRIKVYALVDTHTFYTSNLKISVVKHITAPAINTCRNISMDSYFTSVSLVTYLPTQNTTIAGTLWYTVENKKEILP
ncbi:hypothetical protein PR048_020145 [Dryococelus australis]|uniref:PiggyBac transposable element-derived protein domain-containing protein n=1 Tax=Dryococelus australis TaxID=614101 RepID=A0ABQ9H5K9_9NEOP|nr:hypothetical protein PR048_020145 [Dryococelus australis]